MKFIILAMAMVFVAGCTKGSSVGCAVESSATSLLSATITSQLACKNLDAVKADVQKEVAKLKICDKQTAAVAATDAKSLTAQSAIGDLVCAPVVEGVVSGLLGTIPTAWECTGGDNKDKLKTLLLDACKKSL